MDKILLVDDDPSFLTVIRYILRKYGFQVVGCSSGEEAIELLNSNGFGLVISDFKMGRISGLRVARTALGKKPLIPVFILTAFADGFINIINGESWGSSWKYFPNRVLSKPVDETTLITAIENLGLRKNREISQ